MLPSAEQVAKSPLLHRLSSSFVVGWSAAAAACGNWVDVVGNIVTSHIHELWERKVRYLPILEKLRTSHTNRLWSPYITAAAHHNSFFISKRAAKFQSFSMNSSVF